MANEAAMAAVFFRFSLNGSLGVLSGTHSVKEFGKLHTSVVQSYTRQILEAVSYLHRHEVVHRDVRSFP